VDRAPPGSRLATVAYGQLVLMTYWWRPYVGWGRRQFVVGIRRNRRDRICPEFRYIRLENELW